MIKKSLNFLNRERLHFTKGYVGIIIRELWQLCVLYLVFLSFLNLDKLAVFNLERIRLLAPGLQVYI